MNRRCYRDGLPLEAVLMCAPLAVPVPSRSSPSPASRPVAACPTARDLWPFRLLMRNLQSSSLPLSRTPWWGLSAMVMEVFAEYTGKLTARTMS